MPKRTHQIDRLIVNSPFVEPAKHWSYDRESRLFTLEESRRPAGYVVATPGSKSFDDPGQFIELPLVNQIRPRVKAWREAGYPGASGTTRTLLAHWHDPEQRDTNKRLFFCGLEAIETLIWLIEASPAERQGIVIPGDGGPFERWCTKLATGGGKTNVMAMLITWQILNKVIASQDTRFAKNILVVAPGLTVRNRLRVLVPDSPGNFYDDFSLLPVSLREPFRQGKVKVINWHKLDWDSEEQLAKKKGIDKRGAKSDEAYVRDVLDELASARNLVVVNDEAHHAWRLLPGQHVAGVSRQDRDEATKWVGGLDRIQRARGILRCFDFSATPFIPAGDKSPEGNLFPWIVSDFGLNDAIEAGLVKTPRVVIRDDALPDTRTYKSKLYHIYKDRDVHDDLNQKGALPQTPLPQLVGNAYYLLGVDWLETKKRWEKEGSPTPPVMITVANRTETAARIKYAFDNRRILIDELQAPDKTLHIDSKVLDQAEAVEEAPELNGQSSEEEEGDEEAVARPRTKKEQAEYLRRVVDTVGKPGQPGEHIQNVISVAMLSEGWDAKTVTHIMGLRAFTSQLLCEQVVGRGLRRTSYEVEEDGLYAAEYVNIFGVPFTFLPHEGGDGEAPPPPSPKSRVEALPEREREFKIQWPNVIRIEHVFRPTLKLDLEKVLVLSLSESDIVTTAELAAILGGKPDLRNLTEIQLQKIGEQFRFQKIVFETARDVFEQMKPNWQGNKEVLLAQVIKIVERVLSSDRIAFSQPLFSQDLVRRRILLTLTMSKIVNHIWNAIKFDEENSQSLDLVFDQYRPIASTGDMQPWYTGRPNDHTRRSHINVCVHDGTWESAEAYRLDHSNHVQAWAKNDHLGFEVLYTYNGTVHKFRPDFLIRLTNGTQLVLEVKGQDSEEQRTKRRFLAEWVKAVNQHGEFGHWASDVSLSVDDLETVLKRFST
ncbi:MAG: DEAD/DEAH box helicase family protein [Pirellulales bacterium]